jgi:hypothetical protein
VLLQSFCAILSTTLVVDVDNNGVFVLKFDPALKCWAIIFCPVRTFNTFCKGDEMSAGTPTVWEFKYGL